MHSPSSPLKHWQKNANFSEALEAAVRGVWYAVRNEANVRRQCWMFGVVLVAAIFFRVSSLEFMVLLLVSALVLGVEFVNSSLEHLLDVLHPEYHTAIQHSKDVLAGAVLLTSGVAVIIGLMVFVPRIVDGIL